MSDHSASGEPNREPNRLAAESSPYLRLHQHNPVDWYPWGPEALERARREKRPIFLSVGYSTCYWCHVMERESFSDLAIARLMNESFINIKIDREERPELDEIYMVATQVLAGQGGWPNSVFLTPELEPYFAGTYFPPADAHGRPGFATVLRTMRDAWSSVGMMSESRRRASRVRSGTTWRSVRSRPTRFQGPRLLRRRYSIFSGASIRPGAASAAHPSSRRHRTCCSCSSWRPSASRRATCWPRRSTRWPAAASTTRSAADFHRYATDREWKVPHFEKMLYDNAWLLEVYARFHALTGDPDAARVVRETAEFVRRELTGPEGAFWSALDAETDGHEGAFYVWRQSELIETLGEEDAGFLAPLYGFDGPPFFEGDRYVLHLPARLANQAERRKTTVDDLLSEIEPLRAKLMEERSRRPALATDDKVLADWNGMFINGLAVAGRLQIAFFERWGVDGLATLARITASARKRGFLIVLDAKRGDIGSTATAYAEALLGPGAWLYADAVTVNPYMGADTLEPWLEARFS